MGIDNSKTIACVTGASGMVGRRIVRRLIMDGYRVRALSRRKHFDYQNVELFIGGLDDEDILKSFVFGAHLLFHCAAELYDESKMWSVNVLGTERLLRIVKNSSIKYLCYLSSAGVVGRTDIKWVDEKTKCEPQNTYERSKWAAEQLITKSIDNCRTVILRPTNVIDENRPGALYFLIKNSFLNRFKVFIKGGECAHIVHAEDVADVALYFVSRPIESPQCYFISCDHEPLNTPAGLWTLYRAFKNSSPVDNIRPVLHLPLIIPYILRKLWRHTGNRGDVRYSSRKLISEGFNFSLCVKGAVKKLVSKPDSR